MADVTTGSWTDAQYLKLPITGKLQQISPQEIDEKFQRVFGVGLNEVNATVHMRDGQDVNFNTLVGRTRT